MKPLLYAVAASAILVGFSTVILAQDGHDHAGHDHAAEPHSHAAPKTSTPPSPPSDTFVPESRPAETSPRSRQRTPGFTPNFENRSPRDFRGVEPEPLDFVPPSRPSQNMPPVDRRPSWAAPDRGLWPNDPIPDFEATPRDFTPPSSPLGTSWEMCPLARRNLPCPNDPGVYGSRPCPFGRGTIEECPLGNHGRRGLRFEEYEPPVPASFRGAVPCPHENCGQFQPETLDREIEPYDNLPYPPRRQPVPSLRDEPTHPSQFQTFGPYPPETFRN